MRLLVPIANGWSIRNLLLSGLVDQLTEQLDVVLAVPPGRGNVSLARWKAREFPVPDIEDISFLRLLQRVGKAHLWHTSARVASYSKEVRQYRMPLARRLKPALFEWLARADAAPGRYQRLVESEARWWDSLMANGGDGLEEWFAETGAEAVLFAMPHVLNMAPLARRARNLGLRTIAMVHSFDNLSTKGRHPIIFDHYLVWSGRMRDELLSAYSELDPRSVSVCGAAHFHCYFDRRYDRTREEMARRWELDANRPIALYAAGPARLLPHEAPLVHRFCADLRRSGTRAPQLIVRLHPLETDFERWRLVRDAFPEVRWSSPWETAPEDPSWAVPSEDDLLQFCMLVRHSAVVINAASTMTLDAALCDTPAVCVDYALSPFEDFARHMHNFYDYDHYRPIIESKGVRVVREPEELVETVFRYIENPALDRSERRRLVEEMCGARPDQAIRRIAETVRECLLGTPVSGCR